MVNAPGGRKGAGLPAGAAAAHAGPVLPDCQDCGACCFTRAREHVLLSRDDLDRLVVGGAGRLLKAVTADSASLRTRDTVPGGPPLRPCIALVVNEGCFTCSVYPLRPNACRTLERGSDACLEVFARVAAQARTLLEPHRRGAADRRGKTHP